MQVGLAHFLIVSAILFSLGIFAVVTRRNAILVLMGIELILNAANLNFIAFAKYGGMTMEGQMFAIFVIILAAAEAAIALAIVLAIFRHFHSIDANQTSTLRD